MRFKKLRVNDDTTFGDIVHVLYRNEVYLNKKIKRLKCSVILLGIGGYALAAVVGSMLEEKEKETK